MRSNKPRPAPVTPARKRLLAVAIAALFGNDGCLANPDPTVGANALRSVPGVAPEKIA